MYYIYVYNAYKKNFVDIQDFQNVLSLQLICGIKNYIYILHQYIWELI